MMGSRVSDVSIIKSLYYTTASGISMTEAAQEMSQRIKDPKAAEKLAILSDLVSREGYTFSDALEQVGLSDVYDKKAQYYKEQAKTLDALYPVHERKLNPKIDEMYAMFEIIKDKYGLTMEEFYVWLKSRGINGRVVAGFMEVIPGIEMHELTFFKEQLGDVPEVQVYEKLAAGFAASEEPFILKYLNKQKREG